MPFSTASGGQAIRGKRTGPALEVPSCDDERARHSSPPPSPCCSERPRCSPAAASSARTAPSTCSGRRRFAGYHDGVEHYVTAFEFAGGGGAFGSLIPLPGVPSSVEGRRLDAPAPHPRDEPAPIAPRVRCRGAAAAAGAEVIMKVKIDALDITVLKGGGADVGAWAKAAWLPAPAGCARGPRLLREAQPDLPRRRLRRRRRRRPAASRSATGRPCTSRSPRQPVGAAADPRPRQVRRRARRGRRLPADRPPADAPAGRRPATNGLRLDHSADASSTCSTTFAPTGAWTGSRSRLADEARDRCHGRSAALRPRRRRERQGTPSRVAAGLDARRRSTTEAATGGRRSSLALCRVAALGSVGLATRPGSAPSPAAAGPIAMRWVLAVRRARGLAVAGVGLGATGSMPRPDASRSTSTTRTTIRPAISVPVGVPVTFVLRNDDPIDHEWIVGDAAVHAASPDGHRAHHGPARRRSRSRRCRRARRRHLRDAGTLEYICHLPGHEAYGMTGWLTISS